jgi:hypothetical protein
VRIARLVYAFGGVHFSVADDFGDQHSAPVHRIIRR